MASWQPRRRELPGPGSGSGDPAAFGGDLDLRTASCPHFCLQRSEESKARKAARVKPGSLIVFQQQLPSGCDLFSLSGLMGFV